MSTINFLNDIKCMNTYVVTSNHLSTSSLYSNMFGSLAAASKIQNNLLVRYLIIYITVNYSVFLQPSYYNAILFSKTNRFPHPRRRIQNTRPLVVIIIPNTKQLSPWFSFPAYTELTEIVIDST